jgi:putative methionine-R-sulfoxide reductase with GAF domain
MSDVHAAVDAAADAAGALAAVLSHFGAVTGTLHFLDDAGVLRLAAMHGPLPPPVTDQIRSIPVGKGMAGECARLNAPVSWCNLQQDDRGVVRPGARATGMAGSIVVPVRASGRLVGTLGIASAFEREFTTGETDDLMRAAESMARFRHGARAT